MGQQQPIKTFFVTLRRSQIGKPWFHRQVLDGLGLKKRLLCVEKPNNPVIRGMLRQVSEAHCSKAVHCKQR
jgi:ribosomal protein L30